MIEKNKQLLEKYSQYLSAIGMSQEYFYTLQKFAQYVNQRNEDLHNIDEQLLIEYFNERGKEIKAGRKNNFIKALKHFYIFLYGKERENPFKKISYLKTDRKLKPYITEEEFKKGLRYVISHYSCMLIIKIKALLTFMFYVGLRKEEVISLKRKNFNFEQDYVQIYASKVKRERIVPFPILTKKYLLQYFNIEPEKENAFNITVNQIDNVVKKLGEYFPNKRLSPHSLRHSCAKNLLKMGYDLATIAKFLGHASILTTQIYVDPDEEMIKNIYKQKGK